MQQTVSLIVLLALAARTGVAEVVVKAPESEQRSILHKAMIDILTTCYADPGNTIGVVGDSDGSILKALWSIHSISAILVDTRMKMDNSVTFQNQHRLQVFVVVADSPERFTSLMTEIMDSIWWNHYANFLIHNPAANRWHQCTKIEVFLYLAFKRFGVLNAQAMCLDGEGNVSIVNSNPFTRRAPKPWQFIQDYRTSPAPFNVFKRTYKEGGQACEALSFVKTMDLDGYPLYFTSEYPKFNALLKIGNRNPTTNFVFNMLLNIVLWFVKNIAIDFNASPVIRETGKNVTVGIEYAPWFLSDDAATVVDCRTYPFFREELLAVTQHTGHMSQLDKILSVIDRPSRISMWIVYLITFLFFKFFLRQSVVPSILELVRLTCGTGLVKLPSNVGPRIYLACLFMYVVTFQGIFTGNLATLLTTNIHYPNVNKKQDIVDLGYTVYTTYVRYFDDPTFDGRVVSVSQDYPVDCTVDYVLRDPLAVCVDAYLTSTIDAYEHRLHLSRDTIDSDYIVYMLSVNNPFGRSFDATFTKWMENGLRNRDFDRDLELLRVNLQNDDVVNNNAERKVMSMEDLRFAFVILGIGLTCSIICFVCEIFIYRVRLIMARRRARARNRVFVANRNRPFHC